MKKTLYALLAVMALTMSCKKNETGGGDDPGTSKSGPQISEEIFIFPVSYLGKLDDDDYDAFQIYAPDLHGGITKGEKAFIVVDQDDFSGNETALADAYEDGCIVGILDPDLSVIGKWLEESTDFPLCAPNEDSCYIYCVCNNASYFGKEPYKDEGMDENSEYLDCKYFFEPLILWANERLKESNDKEEGTKADDKEQIKLPSCKYTTSFSFTARKKIWNCGAGSDDDIREGNGTITADLEITPAYCYKGQNDCTLNGDYYDVKARYTVNSTNMYVDHYRKSHGGLTTTYSALFLKFFNIWTYLETDQGTTITDLFCPVDNYPIPESTQQTTHYSKTNGWNIGFGLSGGFKGSTAKNSSIENVVGGSISPSFTFGYNKSTTVSMDVPDLNISNTSQKQYCPSWALEIKNLPHDDGNAPNDISSYCPSIAKANLSLSTHWIWHCKRTTDWDMKKLGNLRTKVSVEYDGIGTDSGGRHTRTLTERNDRYKFTAITPKDTLLAPLRIPFGTLIVKNTFRKDITIGNVMVRNEKGDSVASSTLSKEVGGMYAFNLAVGKYSVSLNAGETRASMKEYKSYPAIITLNRRKSQKDSLILRTHFDFEPVKK